MLLTLWLVVPVPVWAGAFTVPEVRPVLASVPLALDAASMRARVPRPLLYALAYEASRLDPHVTSAWGGYGLFDFREPGEDGPDVELAARLAGVDVDALREDAFLQARAAGALLAWHGENLGLTADAPLEAWADAVAGFSGRQEPNLQQLFVDYIYRVVRDGFVVGGVRLEPTWVDLEVLGEAIDEPPPPPYGYAGIDDYVQASSSNYTNASRGSGAVDYVVIHTAQGSYSGTISWFTNSSAQVSAHYVVRSSDGAITQMLDEADIGWHAGNWDYNELSVGIEHEGYVEDPDRWYTTSMYESSARLTADICARHGIPVDRSRVIGHVEVPGATHTDPGGGWDWSRYMDLIGGDSAGARLIGVVAQDDIYSGPRLAGAVVTLEQTGETTTVDAEGYYSFTDLPTGTWTATAVMDGYQASSCSKDVTSGSGDWWCSIALSPAPDTEPTGGEPGGTESTGDPGAGGATTSATAAAAPFGSRVLIGGLGGCQTTPVSPSLAGLLALLGLLQRRR